MLWRVGVVPEVDEEAGEVAPHLRVEDHRVPLFGEALLQLRYI
jgi:hypothetical protein